MKTALIVAIFALGLSLPAYATKPAKPKDPPVQNQQQHAEGGDAVAIGIGKGGNAEGGHAVSGSQSRSNARSKSDAHAVAKNETAVDASSDVAVDVKTGDTLVETGGTDIDIEGDSHVYDFPSNTSYAPPSFSNIKCGEILGAGYTNTSGSGSIGIPIPRWLSAKIRDCEAEADSNWLAEVGLPLAAIEARCATRSMRARFGGDMKGKTNRTTACVTKLTQLARDEAELEGLRNLAEKLIDENRALERSLSESQEAGKRCTEQWTECQSK